jgi:putative methionine-R-sulfoxide reductase with GAF domain
MLTFLKGTHSSQNQALLKEELSRNEESKENTQAIVRVIQDLEKSDHVVSATFAALERIRSSFHWSYGAYWSLDAQQGVMRFQSESGSIAPEFRRATESATFAKGVGLVGKAWQNKAPFFVDDLAALSDCPRVHAAERAGVQAAVALPVLCKGEVIGVIDF